MSALHELQQAVARAVITGQFATGAGAVAAAAVVADAPGAAARLRIYHNHYRVTLIDALAATFMATRTAVGEEHFRAAARGFILTKPPTDPYLAAYGAGFAAFLAELPPLAAWPYLSDLARLDWAVNAAFHAADAPPLTATSLAAVSAATTATLQVRLHPSCIPLASRYPVDCIRGLLLAGGAVAATDVAEAPCHLLVFRANGEVGWLQLPPAAFTFVAALAKHGSFANATAAAAPLDPAFDPVAHLTALSTQGVVVALFNAHA